MEDSVFNDFGQNTFFLKKESGVSSLVDVLRYRSSWRPDKTVYIFLKDGEEEEDRLTYGELDRRSAAVAVELRRRLSPGDRALLLYPPGLEFATAFFGCLRAGVIAVPVYPPDLSDPRAGLDKLAAVATDCRPEAVLSVGEFLDLAGVVFVRYPNLEKIDRIATDAIDPSLAANWRDSKADPSLPAFIQYTSGSTGGPKGVTLTQANLMYNSEVIKGFSKHTEESIGVGWLPMYHDMGLIGKIIQPLYAGGLCVLMSPVAFLKKPFRWLKAVSRYKATTSGGPNFAYELCLRRISADQLSSLDLGAWKLAFNGAEPVRAETLRRFVEKFKICGFRPEYFFPCYGLAEAVLIVSGGTRDEPPVVVYVDKEALRQNRVVFRKTGDEDTLEIVGCGRTCPGQKIVIADPETMTRLPENRTGEIWTSGPSVASGYWNRPKETEETFRARLADTGEGPFLRTGDLGFTKDGELFVTGRLKDLIIIRGENHHPQDIEQTAEQSHPALRSGCCAAFSTETEGEERLTIVQEIKSGRSEKSDWNKAARSIVKAVSEKHGLRARKVVLTEPGSVFKTSSGKIQRRKCKEAFLKGGLKTLISFNPGTESRKNALSKAETSSSGERGSSGSSASRIEKELASVWAEALRLPLSAIDPEADLSEYGADSVVMAEILDRLEEKYERVVEPDSLMEHPSVRGFAQYLAGENIPLPSAAPFVSRGLKKVSRIAVISLAGRFPGAANIEEFWDNLEKGKSSIIQTPPERWKIEDFHSPDRNRPDKTYSVWGGYMKDVDLFDAAYFGVSEEEALIMDPARRLLLELAQELLDRAGYRKEELSGKAVGVFIGGGSSSYLSGNFYSVPAELAKRTLINAIPNMLAAHISRFFNFTGASLVIDTACSSSLIAARQACRELQAGDCEMAIAGGVELLLDPSVHIAFSRAGILSDENKCFVFDRRAKGVALGEALGLVLLKPYEKAIADGDLISGVILGSAANNDGRATGLTTPNIQGQKDVIRRALTESRTDPETVSYLEAHGAGTLVGDPIEIKAAGEIYGSLGKGSPRRGVGSVKSNIGHTLRAAGICGLIKTLLAVKNKKLPATLNCETPHPRFGFDRSTFYPVAKTVDWEPKTGTRRAAVSSFGFGGTNCHLILEEFSESESAGYKPKRKPLPPTRFEKKSYWLAKTEPVRPDSTSPLKLSETGRGLRLPRDMEDRVKSLSSKSFSNGGCRTGDLSDADAKLGLHVREYIENALRALSPDLEPEALPADKYITDLGIDSHFLIETLIKMEEELSIELHPSLFFEYATINRLTDYFVREHGEVLRAYFKL